MLSDLNPDLLQTKQQFCLIFTIITSKRMYNLGYTVAFIFDLCVFNVFFLAHYWEFPIMLPCCKMWTDFDLGMSLFMLTLLEVELPLGAISKISRWLNAKIPDWNLYRNQILICRQKVKRSIRATLNVLPDDWAFNRV